ncbi:hypothetical protein D915_003617 [Fasciola hepatica]|uniref:Uncharacterized protein n=1 Tax=Fasciola hepatica TaxID=6192 RepID=A0A4E0RFQ5_FASHE|nr:hypothetical protein D915_003617 [Fasciola hepatica]
MTGCALRGPHADPLTLFSAGQLERLNPRIQREIKQLHVISLCCQSSIDETETYATTLDADEWNTNCHLKLIPKDQLIAQLPRAPRNLMVRLTSDRLEIRRTNKYCKLRCKCPRTGPIPTCNAAHCSTTKRAHFLDLYYSELGQKLQRRRRPSQYRFTLFFVGKNDFDYIFQLWPCVLNGSRANRALRLLN